MEGCIGPCLAFRGGEDWVIRGGGIIFYHLHGNILCHFFCNHFSCEHYLNVPGNYFIVKWVIGLLVWPSPTKASQYLRTKVVIYSMYEGVKEKIGGRGFLYDPTCISPPYDPQWDYDPEKDTEEFRK